MSSKQIYMLIVDSQRGPYSDNTTPPSKEEIAKILAVEDIYALLFKLADEEGGIY